MIRLTPTFKEKIWGSTHLEPLFPNSPTKIGEVWFEGVPAKARGALVAEIESRLRASLFRDNAWWADYRRLRVVARR